MTDTPGGLMGFLERMDKDHDDSLNTWAEGGSKWLDGLAYDLFKNWKPRMFYLNGRWYRATDGDPPYEEYDPEDQ